MKNSVRVPVLFFPMFLKGKNRKVGTLLGLGSIASGLFNLVQPQLAGKVPGFPEEELLNSIGSYVPTDTIREMPGMQGFYPTSALPAELGEVNPFATPSLNTYAMGNGVY